MKMLVRELVSRMPLRVELKDLLLVDSLAPLLRLPNLLTKELLQMLPKRCSSIT